MKAEFEKWLNEELPKGTDRSSYELAIAAKIPKELKPLQIISLTVGGSR
jgi:hypothetical protein